MRKAAPNVGCYQAIQHEVQLKIWVLLLSVI